ncbi:hypothetical protein ET495_07170 [Xylanimonas allomyrinae]|uniref:DUF4013 domain-containing protein n=1 Tax=Xylanimonas allomyrinae TaxID=2509459 RepID=A0A4P6EK53_9MICO|nr:hypothetical protein ET495_07170 [Xylanimonas allomyrinae]
MRESVSFFRDVADMTNDPDAAQASLSIGFAPGLVFLSFLGTLVGYMLQVFAWNGALREADGVRPSLGSFFRAPHLGAALLTAVVLGIAATVVSYVPFGGLAWPLFTVFALLVTIDHGATAFGAIGTSFRLVGKNFGSVFLLLLTLVGINIVGALALVVGLLVTIPLSTLAVAYAFRRITGGTIV